LLFLYRIVDCLSLLHAQAYSGANQLQNAKTAW
jgi:hypothetical protein